MISNNLLAPTLPAMVDGQSILLIPETGIQFIDIPIVLPEKKRRFRFSYYPQTENAEGKQPAEAAMKLLRLRAGTDDVFETAQGQAVSENETFNIDEQTILDHTHSSWFPLPFLRNVRGHSELDNGPYNWVRAFITPLEEPGEHGENHRLTLAIDTTTDDSESVYNAPSRKNVYVNSDTFSYAVGNPSLQQFLQRDWLQVWTKNTCRTPDRLRMPESVSEQESQQEIERFKEHYHFALYCGLLQFLNETVRFQPLGFINTSQESGDIAPIDVDFVLDVGNSRTCGILFEHSDPLSLSNCYSFKLRDLNAPAYIHDGPFSSRMEFVDHAFGDEFANNMALGRKAFVWPSIVRVGPEADRLAGKLFGNQGDMGLTSPKRYIWDLRRNENTWFMNPNGLPEMVNRSTDVKTANQGDFMGEFSENGEPLSDENPMPMLVPHFSRSSMMTFFLAELFLQAFHQINAAYVRYNGKFLNQPRRIRRIVLTVPTAMTVEERLIFEGRVQSAKDILWKVLGLNGENGVEVDVRTQWDEAVATQAVFLYNETIINFKGRVDDYFNLFGMLRLTPDATLEDDRREAPLLPSKESQASVRIASIDIGGGTTDLIITTYYLRGMNQIVPSQNFREGFNLAGDDIIGDMIEKLILPHFVIALEQKGYSQPAALVDQLVAPDQQGMQVWEKTMRRQFTSLILQPIAIELIDAYESAGIDGLHESVSLHVGDFLKMEPEVKAQFEKYINEKHRRTGAIDELDLFDTSLFISIGDVDASVRKTMNMVIHNMAEVVYAYDCDYLLLSGRPSRMPAVRDLLLSNLPLDTNRLINMHEYVVGDWYPYHSINRRLNDPKTTVSVGAMVCALSQLNLQGFFMYSDLLTMRSTARYIGYMAQDYSIRADHVLFNEVDLDDEDLGGANPEIEIEYASETMLGFRQMRQSRWQATPYYFLYYDKKAGKKKQENLVPPYKLTLRLRKPDKKRPYAIEIETAEDSRGISVRDVIKIRLQTLPFFGRNAYQHWLDVGAFDAVEIMNAHRFYQEKNGLGGQPDEVS